MKEQTIESIGVIEGGRHVWQRHTLQTKHTRALVLIDDERVVVSVENVDTITAVKVRCDRAAFDVQLRRRRADLRGDAAVKVAHWRGFARRWVHEWPKGALAALVAGETFDESATL